MRSRFALIPIGLLSLKLMALSPDQLGSDGFVTMTENTFPWSDSVQIARDPSLNTNILFVDQQMFPALSDPDTNYIYGMADKEFIAESLNVSANMTMAAAKTDPRNVQYIDKSLVSSIERLSSENPGDLGNLSQKQLGDSTYRFIEGQSISPNIGTLQSTDNEAAFQATFDNIMLGQAEEALYEGDRLNAISHFNSQSDSFKDSSDKQAQADSYQRDGILRSKQTAETFRDFFAYKSDVTGANLAAMPTVESLLGNCKSNTPQGEDLNGVFNNVVSSEELSFYEIKPPSYNVDYCESYIQTEQDALLKNLPVHEKLGSIIDDSNRMASGLDGVARKLSQDGLTTAELAQILANDPTWNELGARQKAYKECAEKSCLEELKGKVESVINYPGAEKELSPERLEMRKNLALIIRDKRLPGSIAGLGSGRDFKSSGQSTFTSADFNRNGPGSSSGVNGAKKTLKDTKAQLVDEAQAKVQGQSGLTNNSYQLQGGEGRRARGVFYRDENGVLRGPSGKPIMFSLRPAHEDIFKVISSRYQKKFFDQNTK